VAKLAIPRKIKKYPGLVKAWQMRTGLYDPKPKKRTNKRMATGYGTVNKKPFRRGSRGGVAWTGGRKPRYDPNTGEYRQRTRKKAKKGLAKLYGFMPLIAGLIAFVIPTWAVYKHYKTTYPEMGLFEFIKRFWSHEAQVAVGLGGEEWPITKYWSYKLTDTANSAWAGIFMVSLTGLILSKFKIISMVSPKLNTIVGKVTFGTLIASLIGAFIVPGAYHHSKVPSPHSNLNTSTSTPTGDLSSYYG